MPFLDIENFNYFLNISKNYILTTKLSTDSNHIKHAGLFSQYALDVVNLFEKFWNFECFVFFGLWKIAIFPQVLAKIVSSRQSVSMRVCLASRYSVLHTILRNLNFHAVFGLWKINMGSQNPQNWYLFINSMDKFIQTFACKFFWY